jgi:hypothetical protein
MGWPFIGIFYPGHLDFCFLFFRVIHSLCLTFVLTSLYLKHTFNHVIDPRH